MTENISRHAAAARESARQDSGQFGTQEHTAPESPLIVATTPEDTVYGVYDGDTLISVGEKGAGMTEALHRARVYANSLRPKPGEPRQAIIVRSEGSDVSVPLPYEGDGRLVGWQDGDAVTAEEMDKRGVSLTQLEGMKVEPFIDFGRHEDGDLPHAEKWASDGGFYISNIYAVRDDETGGRHIDIGINEDFLWNAESQCPDSEYDDDSDLDPDDDRPAAVQRYEAWLDKNEDIVKEVYLEWFNADVDAPSWDAATITLRKTVPFERFTESLIIEDIYPLLAKHANETDPGTFGSPYIMGEVRRRVEAREEEAERQAERAGSVR